MFQKLSGLFTMTFFEDSQFQKLKMLEINPQLHLEKHGLAHPLTLKNPKNLSVRVNTRMNTMTHLLDLGTELKVQLQDLNSQRLRHNVKKVERIWPNLHIFPIEPDKKPQLQT